VKTFLSRPGILVVLLPLLASGPRALAGEPAPPKFPPDKLVEDFRLARKALEEGHSGIYRYTPKPELDRVFDRAEKSLDRPMDVFEFYRVVAPAVAAVKCGHTGPALPRNAPLGPVLPLRVRLVGGKVYVFRDLSAEGGRLAGMEVRSVNGVPAGDIVKTLLAAAPGDGDVQTSRARRAVDGNFAPLLKPLLGIGDPFDLVLWDSGRNEEVRVRLPGLPEKELAAAWREKFPQDHPPSSSASLRFEDGGAVAILKIVRFGGTAGPERKPLGKFIDEAFAEIDAKKCTALVLDLRDNGGGADELGKRLLSHLVDQPFRYYDDLVLNALDFSFRKKYTTNGPLSARQFERRPDGKYRMTSHPNWGEHKPGDPVFHGKVYALINGGSFSTTCEFLSHLHARKRATFIGAESGGGYYGNTSGPGLTVTLPNTKLLLRVPLMTYYLTVPAGHDPAHGVVPDRPVTCTIGELLAGKDKEMELALELARRP
jgi:hypothetical protein